LESKFFSAGVGVGVGFAQLQGLSIPGCERMTKVLIWPHSVSL